MELNYQTKAESLPVGKIVCAILFSVVRSRWILRNNEFSDWMNRPGTMGES